MITLLASILIIFIEILFCNIFLDIFLQYKTANHVIKKNLIIGIVTFGAIIISFLCQIMMLKVLIIVSFISFFMYQLYESSFKKILLLVLIFYGILLGIDFLAIIAIDYLFPEETITYKNNPFFGIIIALLCRVVFFCCMMLIKRNWNKNNNLNLMSDSQWMKFLYFPILSILALCAMLVNFDTDISISASNTLIIIACGLVVMNLLVFNFMKDIIEREKQIQSDIIFKERMKNETNIYRSMSENYETQRKRIHEHNNQMECIEGMLLKQNVDEALNYLGKITGGLKSESELINTNHVIINTIINKKYQEAQDKQIVMTMKVNDLSGCGIRDEDLVTILSNLLNNAIEACEKLSDKRIIWLKFAVENNMTIISVKNTVSENLEINDENLVTTKANKSEHGFGIKNIKECVEKYKGSYTIQSKDGLFFFGILIPDL